MYKTLKIKIFNIIPYWFIALTILLALQNFTFLITKHPDSLSKIENSKALPTVLGVETSVRGTPDISNRTEIIQISEPNTKSVTAQSFIAFDLSTGKNILEKNTDSKLSIASLTKLLTSFVAYQNTDLHHEVIISKEDIIDIKPNLNLNIGDKVKALDLFNAMLIGSCNDAALSLANFVSNSTGTNFVKIMNSQAKSLGMSNSNFSNPMGFDSKYNYSTANDLKKLILSTERLAVYKNLGRRTNYEFLSEQGKKYSTVATNKLITKYPDIEAIKTGHTEMAKGTMATKFSLHGEEIVIIILGSIDREGDTLKIKSEISNNFKVN